MEEYIRESSTFKIFYHQAKSFNDCYWLLCKTDYIGRFKYYRILRKIEYIDLDGTIKFA
jgi:hypothetical protein